jgi:hypothetical protein
LRVFKEYINSLPYLITFYFTFLKVARSQSRSKKFPRKFSPGRKFTKKGRKSKSVLWFDARFIEPFSSQLNKRKKFSEERPEGTPQKKNHNEAWLRN